MEKLELRHLSRYLPYGLKVWNLDMGVDFDLAIQEDDSGIDIESVLYASNIYKPILRPLSDLFKLIDWDNNGDPYMIGHKCGIKQFKEDGVDVYVDEHSADYCQSPVCYVDITVFNWWLFEYHFDVFGLIDRGLAVDINEI